MRALFAKKQMRVLLIAAAVVAVIIIVRVRINHAHEAKTRDGIALLETMESADVAAVEGEIRELAGQKLKEQQAELRQQIESGETDVWSYFKDFVVMGDSRAVGFYYFEFMPKERVFADGGNTIRDIEKSMAGVEAIQPACVFLCYGLNDVSIGYWDEPAEYVKEYAEVVHGMQEKLPDTTIFISSTLPAKDPAFEKSEKWRRIPEFNDALKEMCEQENIPFIDNTEIVEQHFDLWDVDGIHVRKEFYKYWATDMLLAVLERNASGDDAEAAETAGTTDTDDTTESTDTEEPTEMTDAGDATDTEETTEEVPA